MLTSPCRAVDTVHKQVGLSRQLHKSAIDIHALNGHWSRSLRSVRSVSGHAEVRAWGVGHGKVFLRQIYRMHQRCWEMLYDQYVLCGAGSRMLQDGPGVWGDLGSLGGSWYRYQGEFKPPIRVHDDRSLLEAQLWSHALQETGMERSSE